jgi:hypothetical protein
MFVYPTGFTQKTTTKQGKTTFCRVVANILEPAFQGEVTVMNRGSGAPQQRTLADPIFRFGFAIYDEFILPTHPEHFLGKEGLQSLATGGKAGPGRVGKNDGALKLKHPLFFSAKVSAMPEDLRNRQVASFLDVLTPETACAPDMLVQLMSPKLALTLRCSILRWVFEPRYELNIAGVTVKKSFADVVKYAKICPGIWRFEAHVAIASILGAGDLDCVKRYLQAADKQCAEQLTNADEAGLCEEIGATPVFDIRHFWETADISTLTMMMGKQDMEGNRKALDVLRDLVENGGKRDFARALSMHNMREKGASMRFIDFLKDGPLENEMYRLSFVPRDDGNGGSRRAANAVRMECLKASGAK